MRGCLECFTVKLLGLIVRALPQRVVVYLGGKIGSIIYFLDRKHRKISFNNLKLAFGSTKTDLELKEIARRSFMNLSQSFFEVLLFPKFKAQSIDRFITIKGREYLDLVRTRGKGGILLTAHFGSWELSAVWAGLKGYPLSILAREQKQTQLNSLLNKHRMSSGLKVYAKGMVVRNLIRALYKNEFVGILGDQDAGRRGVFVNFFRRPASTHPGAVLLALRTGAPILSCFIVRSGFKHKIYVNPPLYLEAEKKGGNTAAVIKAGLEEYNRILESYIRLHPEQWLWVHRRWKTRPIDEKDFTARQFNIMILSDGKAGHLRQSRGIARGFPAAKILEVKIDIRSKFWKLILPLLAPLLQSSFLIKIFLRKSLTKQSLEQLNSFLPRVIISSGSSLAVYNLLFGRLSRAKKIVCMKPGIIPVKFFDLVIAPRHDHLPIIKNVLNTSVSPHPFKRGDFEFLARTLKNKFSLKGERFLGLLIGGDSSHFSISEHTAKRIVEQVKQVCREHKFKLLISTSRRTPVLIEKGLKDALKDFSDLELFISPREESYNPVGGILGLSEVIVVTEDSISMIAEATSSGKKIVVLQIERKTRMKTAKHIETIQNLVRNGYIRLAEPHNLSRVIRQVLLEKFSPKILNDTEKAIERVKEIIG